MLSVHVFLIFTPQKMAFFRLSKSGSKQSPQTEFGWYDSSLTLFSSVIAPDPLFKIYHLFLEVTGSFYCVEKNHNFYVQTAPSWTIESSSPSSWLLLARPHQSLMFLCFQHMMSLAYFVWVLSSVLEIAISLRSPVNLLLRLLSCLSVSLDYFHRMWLSALAMHTSSYSGCHC